MTDFSEIASFAEMDLRESERQIELLDESTKWPEEARQQFRMRLTARLPQKRQACAVLRAVAETLEIHEIVAKKMEGAYASVGD
jgi:hypothetical protein